MAFDAGKFDNESFAPRTADVPVPAMAPFFAEGTPAVFKVQGLTGEQIAQAREAASEASEAKAIVAEAAKIDSDKLAAIKTLIGAGGDSPVQHVLQMNIVMYGLVDPVMTLQQVVRFATAYPIEFGSVHQKILVITGLGHIPKKHTASTKTHE